ncbi:OFA family MFS transporter [Slackia heliotrinireducens]|uniref:OFA family MFS transporter n=1 Tax=Slackia heliotrinireducens TaxID=84110 RepID=UPI00331508A8
MSQTANGVSKRWLLLAITFVLLCFFGLIYAWSLFIEPLESNFGWQRSQTSAIFTISCVTVCLGMVVSGVLTSKFNYRLVMAVSAIMISVGFIASAFCNSLIEIFIYYGVLVGTGVGIGFNCAINTTLNWFPDKQGIVSGTLLMGYGGGAMILSPLVTMLLGVLDWRMTFGVLGVLFGVLVILGAILLRNPSPEQVAPLLAQARENNIVSSVDYTPVQMIKTPAFWICFIWLTLSTSGGLALISQAVPAAMEVLESAGAGTGAAVLATATAAMGSVSLCNGLGRLINGFVWDKLGYRASFTWISLAFMAGMVCCALAVKAASFPLLVVGFVLLGLTFGGTMSATSAVCGTFSGTKHFGINYALMCCQMIPAAIIGPTLLAATQSGSGSYGPAFWAFFALAVVTAVSSIAIRRPKQQAQIEIPDGLFNAVDESVQQPA